MNFDVFWDILFPPECLACGQPLMTGTLCSLCRHHVGSAPRIAIKPARECRACYFLAGAGHYENHVLKTLIHALKFGGVRNAAEPLADMLASRAAAIALPLATFTVMPIPLSRQRQRERGFNQSSLIARRFARALGSPFEENVLARTGHRKPQSTTRTLAERRLNVHDCFIVRHGARCRRDVILIDDVSTSGSTFSEAVRVLTDAGAVTILALAAALA